MEKVNLRETEACAMERGPFLLGLGGSAKGRGYFDGAGMGWFPRG